MKNRIGPVNPKNPKNRKNLKNNDFYNSLKLTFNIAKLFGTIPVSSIEHLHSKRRKIDLYSTSLYFLFYLALSSYSLLKVSFDYDDRTIIPKSMVVTESLLSAIPIFLNLGGGYIFRNVLKRAVSLTARIDSHFPPFHRNDVRTSAFLACMSLSILTKTILIVFTLRTDFLQQLTIFFVVVMITFPKYHFVLVILEIRRRFVAVNDKIANCNGRSAPREFIEELRSSCRLHYKLCNVARMINVAFGLQLFSSIATSSVNVLVEAYYLYVVLSRTNAAASPDIWILTRAIVCTFGEFAEIYLLIYVSNMVCVKANEAPIILHELRSNARRNVEIEKQIQMRSLEFLHQTVKFSAMGFFNMDYPLLYAIASNLITYIVIVIQFDQNRPSGSSKNSSSTF